MRNVVYAFNTSLDGYIEGPDGKFEWSSPSEDLHRYFNDLELQHDVHVYGRRLWEVMQYWLTAGNDDSDDVEREFAQGWRQAEHVVASRTLESVEGGRVVNDAVAEVERLKAQDGKDISVGGAELAGALMERDLIDEVYVMIHPVLVGGGRPMFAPIGLQTNLKLLETKTFSAGVVMLHYGRAEA